MDVRATIRRVTTVRTALSLAVVLVVVGLASEAVGAGEALAALASVSPARGVSLLLVGFSPVVLWGGGLRLVLGTMGLRTPTWRAVLLFAAATFANGVTPFGQVGGDAVSGLFVSRDRSTPYETGLTAVTSVNAVTHLAAVPLGVVGGVYLGSRAAVDASVRTAVLAAAAALLYRAAAFWVPTAVGGLVAAFVLASSPTSGGRVPAGESGARDGRPGDRRVAFAVAAVSASLLLLVVHVRTLLVEPSSLAVHVLRDASLGVMAFSGLWALFLVAESRRRGDS
jgi:uncharacterized membrane protein YbhN (UPF0104 family)